MENYFADLPLKKITYKKAQKLFDCGAEFYLCPHLLNPEIANGINATRINNRIRFKGWKNFQHLYVEMKAIRCSATVGKKLACYAEPKVLKRIQKMRAAA